MYRTSWASWVFVEAMKFWFYSLILGILLAFIELGQSSYTDKSVVRPGGNGVDEKVAEEAALKEQLRAREQALRRTSAVKKIVIDGCDLFTPGAVTGWLVVSSSNVGILCAVSTVLAGTDVWHRVQNTG